MKNLLAFLMMAGVCAAANSGDDTMKRSVKIDRGVALAVELPDTESPQVVEGLPERVVREPSAEGKSELVHLKLPTIEVQDEASGEVRRLFISYDQSHSDTYQWICDQFGYGKVHTLRHGRFPLVDQMVRVHDPAEGSVHPVDSMKLKREALARRLTEVICHRK